MASSRALALTPSGRAPVGAVLVDANSTRPCLCAPVVSPSSSASMLITMPQSSCATCASAHLVSGPRVEFVVLFQRAGPAGTPWLKLQQTVGGRHLPLEIGAVRCPLGCRLRLRTGLLESPPTGHVVTPSPLKDIHDLHVDSAGYRRGAQRLEFFVRPPLHPVRLSSAQAFTNSFADALGIHRYRLVPVEISTTGRFLLVDLLEQDLYEYVSGLWNREVLDKVHEMAGRVNITMPGHATGHTFDERFGIWIQSRNSWTLEQDSNQVWPAGESERDRQGPLMWTLLGVMAGLTLATVAIGVRRVVSRHLKLRARRRPGEHGHYTRKPTHDEVVPAVDSDDSGDEDFFLQMANRVVF